MKARHQVSRNAIELIKRFEGYRESAAQLADGRWTIGYGHTLTAREGASVSADDAEALLMYDLIAVSHAVNEHSYTPLNQNQFDALTSFAFNVGVENFRRSAVLRRINEGALIQAACAMELWRKADFGGERIVIDALVRRRSAEKNLFLTPPDGWIAAPSPILPPKVDYDAAYSVPRQTPIPVVSSLDGARAEAHLDGAPMPAPVVPEEELEPTASERAAAAVTARLEALLPEEGRRPDPSPPVDRALDAPPIPEPGPFPEPAPPPPPASEAPAASFPVAAAWTAPSVTPTPREQAELSAAGLSVEGPPAPLPRPSVPQPRPDLVPPPAAAKPESKEPFEDESAPEPGVGAVRLTGDRGVVASFDPAFHQDSRLSPAKATPLLAVAAVGLVAFAGGVFGGLSAVSEHSSDMLAAKVISWGLCAVGAIAFVGAAYLLLRLIDGEQDDA